MEEGGGLVSGPAAGSHRLGDELGAADDGEVGGVVEDEEGRDVDGVVVHLPLGHTHHRVLQ